MERLEFGVLSFRRFMVKVQMSFSFVTRSTSCVIVFTHLSLSVIARRNRWSTHVRRSLSCVDCQALRSTTPLRPWNTFF